MSHKIFRLFASLTFVLALAFTQTGVAFAAAFNVDSTTDSVDANPGDGVCATAAGECTLRAAIMEANALAGEDTITLPAGIYTLTIAGAGEGAAATGDLDITSNMTIIGADASTTIIDAVGIDRVIHIPGSSTVVISGVTISGGRPPTPFLLLDVGGGIANFNGVLTLMNSIISSNGGSSGGGIYNNGILTITHSTISNNAALGFSGGGIYNTGLLTITHSTISDNRAGAGPGGGILHATGMLTVINSTISNNMSGMSGGGLAVDGSVSLNNVTLANNAGGDISNFFGSLVNFKNTLIAGNCSGMLNSQGYNLIQDTTGCTIGGDTTGNLTDVDPLLGALQNNGGPTFTHALLLGSPAIEAGNPSGCTDQNGNLLTIDQRGVTRPQGARCDIGAFELEATGGVEEVTIDIKPGSQSNPINPKSSGKIPVAILSTPNFNAPLEVDRASLTFGSTGDELSLVSCNKKGTDVNGDGLRDLVCHFKTKLAGFKFGDTEGILKGQTLGGVPIEGSDVVRVLHASYP